MNLEEDKYSLLVKQMFNGYVLYEIIFDKENNPVDYIFLEMNPACEKMSGLSEEVVIGKRVSEIIPEIVSGWINHFNTIVKTGRANHFEHYDPVLDCYFEASAFLLSKNRLGCMFIDISERRKSELIQKENEVKLKNYFDNAPDGIFVTDETGKYLEVNTQSEKITGYTKEELLSMSISDFMLPETMEEAHKHFKEVGENGRASGEFKFRHKSGKILWWSVDAVRLSDTRLIGFAKDITERKNYERQLAESETRFKALHNASFGGISIHDKGIIIECNRGLSEMTGYSVDELTGMDGLALIAEKSRDFVMEKILSGYEKPYEAFGLRKNGEEFPMCLEARNIPYKGKTVRTVEFRDITERKKSEEKLRENQKNLKIQNESLNAAKLRLERNQKELRETQKITKTGSWYLDLETNEVSWSKELYKMYDFNPELPVPHYSEHKKLFTPESWILLSESLENTKKTGIPYELELKMVRKDGSTGWMWVRGEAVFNSEKEITALWGAAQNITERKEMELALANEKERLAVTLRSIGDGVITTDTDGNIMMVNKIAQRLTGRTARESMGKRFTEIFNVIDEFTGKTSDNLVDKVLSTGLNIDSLNYNSLISKDGREIKISYTGSPIYDEEGRIIGVVIVFRDMTEKIKLDETIQRSQKLESLGVLAGGIAHDFNNILGGLFGFIELAMNTSEKESVKAFLSESLNSMDRARALTQQLLTFSKGGAPVKKLDSLFPFLEKSCHFILSGSSVKTEFDIEKNLWLCNYDRNQIGQVMDNIIINAQQAMPDGGIIHIKACNVSLEENENSALNAGQYVKLSITDQGIGIPKEFLPRIFDPYYTTKTKGQGLGLATCFSIINRHGGSIEVESSPGKGSTFHIYLQAADEKSKKVTEHRNELHRGEGTILVMDDEESIRVVIQEMLENFGYDVVTRENGRDAVDYFIEEYESGHKFKAVIFDLTIPGGMGGKEAIKLIREISTETLAFVASGYSKDPVMASPEEYGFNDSISKPFRMKELMKLLNRHITENKKS